MLWASNDFTGQQVGLTNQTQIRRQSYLTEKGRGHSGDDGVKVVMGWVPIEGGGKLGTKKNHTNDSSQDN